MWDFFSQPEKRGRLWNIKRIPRVTVSSGNHADFKPLFRTVLVEYLNTFVIVIQPCVHATSGVSLLSFFSPTDRRKNEWSREGVVGARIIALIHERAPTHSSSRGAHLIISMLLNAFRAHGCTTTSELISLFFFSSKGSVRKAFGRFKTTVVPVNTRKQSRLLAYFACGWIFCHHDAN